MFVVVQSQLNNACAKLRLHALYSFASVDHAHLPDDALWIRRLAHLGDLRARGTHQGCLVLAHICAKAEEDLAKGGAICLCIAAQPGRLQLLAP